MSCLKRAFRARFCRRSVQSETCVSEEVTTKFGAETGVVRERCVSAPFINAVALLSAKPVSQEVARQLIAETPLERLHVQRNVGRTTSKVPRNGSFAFLPDRVNSTCVDINAGTAYAVNPRELAL